MLVANFLTPLHRKPLIYNGFSRWEILSRPLRQSFKGLAGTRLLALFRCGSSENEARSRGGAPANRVR